jgi:hypothetical protein
MKLHEVNCTCRVCQQRRITIEQHFGRGDQRYRKQNHHKLVEMAWNAKMYKMVMTTFRKCHTILLENSPNFRNSKWNNQRYDQFKPFTDEDLKEMTENRKKKAYMGHTWQNKTPTTYNFGEDSIESLLGLYTYHKNLENELILICEQASPIDVKVQSIKSKIQEVYKLQVKRNEVNEGDILKLHGWRNTPYHVMAKHSPWINYFEKFHTPHRDLLSEINAEIKRLDVLERQNTIDRFMKIGPDMPEYLAEAMADKLVSQQEAAEIFRNGWHRNDVSAEVLAAYLRSKTPVKNSNEQTLILDFQTAQWLHSHHKHNSLILAVVNSEMKIETARELLNSDFQNFPDATNAIVAGNPIETVAMMYGIILQPIESEEDSPPISPPQEANKEGPSSSKNKEWVREFDD